MELEAGVAGNHSHRTGDTVRAVGVRNWDTEPVGEAGPEGMVRWNDMLDGEAGADQEGGHTRTTTGDLADRVDVSNLTGEDFHGC